MLIAGRGVPRDAQAAVRYYRTACTKKVAECNALGVQYAIGKALPKDNKAAVRLYTRACTAKSLWGCYNLAKHLQKGSGIAADPARATRLFRWACSQGHRKSCDRAQPRGDQPK